jgi:hypothetical protein
MTTDPTREGFIAAVDALGMTDDEAGSRLGVGFDIIEHVRAGKIWGQGIPERRRAAVVEIIAAAAALNGARVSAAEADDPIEIPDRPTEAEANEAHDPEEAEAIEEDRGVEDAGPTEGEGSAGREHQLDQEEEAPDVMEGLLAAAKALKESDRETARAIMKTAIRARVDEIARDQLLAALAKSLKLRTTKLQTHWAQYEAEVAEEDAVPPTPEELQAKVEAEAKAKAEAEAKAKTEADALYAKCKHIAEDKQLIPRFIEMVHRSGVVHEQRNIVAIKLTVASRLLDEPSSLLIKGASASGKNTVIEKVLIFSRDGADCIVLTAASAKALIYMEESLSHIAFYVPEAAALAQRANGDEDPFAAMLRTMISERRIVYHVSEQIEDENGKRWRSRRIEKPGPVGLLMTTARENVEEELETRLIGIHSDESVGQTRAVLTAAAARAMGRTTPPTADEIEAWREFEDYLRLDSPYRVVVPFADKIAIRANPNAVRMRRDFSSVMALTMGSAVLHKAQRAADLEGRIVATLRDYEYAIFAVLGGITASQAGTEIDTHAIAVGVYWLIDRKKREFRLTHLAKRLAEELAGEPACAAARPTLTKLSIKTKAPSLEEIHGALAAAGVIAAPAVWRRCVWRARQALRAALTKNLLHEPTSRRISRGQLAAALGTTPKITRTRLNRALEDGVVFDDEADLSGRPRTAAHTLRVPEGFSFSKSPNPVRRALPSGEEVRAASGE